MTAPIRHFLATEEAKRRGRGAAKGGQPSGLYDVVDASGRIIGGVLAVSSGAPAYRQWWVIRGDASGRRFPTRKAAGAAIPSPVDR